MAGRGDEAAGGPGAGRGDDVARGPEAGSGATDVRLDVFLNRTRLLKSRTLAKEACDRGKITANGEPAKASRAVRPGDRVRIDLGLRVIEVEVLGVPPGQISKKEARDLYRVIEDRRVEP